VIFFARYEASQFGSPYIESERRGVLILRSSAYPLGRDLQCLREVIVMAENENKSAFIGYCDMQSFNALRFLPY
jgi:hypothetical protein